MATSRYTNAALAASRMIRAKGQFCTLLVGGIAGTAKTVAAVLFDYPERDVNGSMILRGDKQAICEAIGLTTNPVPGVDYLRDAAGLLYSIVDCKPLAPAGTPVIFTLQVRSGG